MTMTRSATPKQSADFILQDFSVLPSTLNYDYDKLENPYTYDPEKAKQILDDAGIVDTDGDGIRELDGQNINLQIHFLREPSAE
ncbi:MAG: hypothetical protein ACLSBD_05740 [Blautia massiliensis (ex Durand et al. 2017)]